MMLGRNQKIRRASEVNWLIKSITMQLQLTTCEIGEYAKLKHKFFDHNGVLHIDQTLDGDPDYHRYLLLNRKIIKMYKFWCRLQHASPSVYIRVQRVIERRFEGKWIRGFSFGRGMILEESDA